MEKTLHILLIEDDMNTCNRISNYIATKDNMDLAGVTNNSYVGIQYVQNTLPDAVILDLELHHGGGTYPQNPPGTGAHWYQSKGCWLQISDRCHYDNN